jgi:hypothetical protein
VRDSTIRMEKGKTTSKSHHTEIHLQDGYPYERLGCPSLFWESSPFRWHISTSWSNKGHPFQQLLQAPAAGAQAQGTSELVWQHPGRRSWQETGQLSLATETCLPGLFLIPTK